MYALMQAIARKERFRVDEIIVLKCGGSALDDLSDQFFENIRYLQKAGKKLVIVHGGGPAIGEMLEQLQIKSEFIDGLRKTTEEMMDTVEMVIVGKVNPALTRRVNSFGLQAVGLSGSDLTFLHARPIDKEKYGLVGEVSYVNTDRLRQLLDVDVIPVISPIALGEDGKRYNVNADTAAGAIASALRAEELIFVTDVPGILHDGKLLEHVTTSQVESLITKGVIYGGMIPKVEAALDGIYGNVHKVMIVNGKDSQLKTKTELKGTTIHVDSHMPV